MKSDDVPEIRLERAPTARQGAAARGLKPLGLLRYPATDAEIEAFVAQVNAESRRLQAEHDAKTKGSEA